MHPELMKCGDASPRGAKTRLPVAWFPDHSSKNLGPGNQPTNTNSARISCNG